MSFNELFGGNPIYPSDPTFLARTLTEDLVFQWPLEQNMAGLEVLAAEIELTPDAAGHSVLMPDATQGSTGYTTTFYNAGADSFTIKDSAGGTLGVVASGTAWTLWLRDNTTIAGLWRVFQMGAATSAANAAALAGAGLVAISTTLNEEMEILSESADYPIVNADRAKSIIWTGGVGTFTLPDPGVVGANWFVAIKNSGNGSLTVNPFGSETIDGGANLVLGVNEDAWIVTDGTDWFTFGFGQTNNSSFDFLSMSVAGSGDLVLSGAQLNRIAYEFTGVLTGNRNIIVPATIQQYWVTNSTTGAFILTVKAAGGSDPGTVVQQTGRSILYSNGTNVVPAETINDLTFSSGTATSPGIKFTSTQTGFYNVGGVLGISTAGVSRGTISILGAWSIPTTDSGTAPTLIVAKRVSGGGQLAGLRVDTDFDSSVQPGIHINSLGTAVFSLTSDNGTLGTNDFRIVQSTGTRLVTIQNSSVAANAAMNIRTLAATGGTITISPGNSDVLILSSGAGSNVVLGVSANSDSIGFRTLTQASVGAAGGATALPATPLGYMTVTVNGVSVKIPYYNP